MRQATDLPFETWTDDAGPGAALSRLLGACDIGPGVSVAVDEAMRADFALLLLDALDGPRRSFCAETVGHLRAIKDADEEVGLDGQRPPQRCRRPGRVRRVARGHYRTEDRGDHRGAL